MFADRQHMRKMCKALVRKSIVLFSNAFRTGRRNPQTDRTNKPRRILLLNGFHVGDVIIATSVIPVLRRAYPEAQIGFLTGNWSHMVVKGHPDLAYSHQLDHWRINREPISRIRKLLHYYRTRRAVLGEIRALNYDIAISLFTNYPDFLDLTWQADIPMRIGFCESVYAGFATDLVDEPRGEFVTHGERLAETLRALPIDPALMAWRRPSLPPDTPHALQEAAELLCKPRFEDARYCIIHMGSGAAVRELPVSFWRQLAFELSQVLTVVFTGRGEREKTNIDVAIAGLQNCINACNRITWEGFVALVRQAQVLYGVESMAGHLAGALGTPCVVVYGGTAGVGRWRPEGKDCMVFSNHVSCAPCLNAKGCGSMTCMKGIDPGDLIRLGPVPAFGNVHARATNESGVSG